MSIVSAQFLFALLFLAVLEILCYQKGPTNHQDEVVVQLQRHTVESTEQQSELFVQVNAENHTKCGPQSTPCKPCANNTTPSPCTPCPTCEPQRETPPCEPWNRHDQSEVQLSWSFLHKAYVDRAEFYQLQSSEKCLLSHFLYPVKKDLYYVNEAQVSFPTTVILSTNRYNKACNGRGIIHNRQMSMQTAVTNVGQSFSFHVEHATHIQQHSPSPRLSLQKHIPLQRVGWTNHPLLSEHSVQSNGESLFLSSFLAERHLDLSIERHAATPLGLRVHYHVPLGSQQNAHSAHPDKESPREQEDQHFRFRLVSS